jgi:hypothetical protein
MSTTLEHTIGNQWGLSGSLGRVMGGSFHHPFLHQMTRKTVAATTSEVYDPQHGEWL